MKKIFLTALIVNLILLSCKVTYKRVNDVLKVKEVFVQEEVSGNQNERSKIYITVRFKENLPEDIIIEQLSILDNETLLVGDIKVVNRTIKKEIEKQKSTMIDNLQAPSLLILFTKGKKHLSQKVEPLLRKEPLYLP